MQQAERQVGEIPRSSCVCVHATLQRDLTFSDVVVTRSTDPESAELARQTVEAWSPLPAIPDDLFCLFEHNPMYMSFGGGPK
jgi:hypothetical protein